MGDNRMSRAFEWIGEEIEARGQSVFLDAARRFRLDEWDLRKKWKVKETYRQMISDRRDTP